MSQQALDLRRSTHLVRRHKVLVGACVVLGILGGCAYSMLHPPMLTSTALVVLPQAAQNAAATGAADTGPDSYMATQAVIAGSNAVLSDALPHVRPAMSLDKLRAEVQVAPSATSYIISVSASGKSPGDVEATANAVANSYIAYVGGTSSPIGRVPAILLEPATTATGRGPVEMLLVGGILGALAGAGIGVVTSLAVGRRDRRLRERDEIADSIGVPVLASIPVAHPSDAAAWTRLLEDYKPTNVHAWRLRKALHQLGAADIDQHNGNGGAGSAIVVLSLSSDPGALALGPQLAAFAASLGIPTALVVGPQQDLNVTASLRTACAVPRLAPRRPSQLRVTVTDDSNSGLRSDAALMVVVAVVDSQAPRVPDTARTTTTVLGVSAGAATAEQLARVAVNAAAHGREIVGILVADPEPADKTTGQIPQLTRPARRRLPTRLSGITTEITR